MIIHCTQKLLAELGKKPKKEGHSKDSFWSWHATLFYIKRRKCVLATNDLTLFTIFMPALTKPDFESFDFVFGQHLFKNLLYETIPQGQIETILTECKRIQYARTDNRSVLGSMNNQRTILEYIIENEGGLARTDIYRLNCRLNRNILSAIDYKHPIEELLEKLQEIT